MDEHTLDWLREHRDQELAEAFLEFHKENPQVLRRLTKMAKALKRKGHKRVGIAMLFETLRWQHMMRTVGEPFKLNNNYRAFYSRMIEDKHPHLIGFFTKRKSAAD